MRTSLQSLSCEEVVLIKSCLFSLHSLDKDVAGDNSLFFFHFQIESEKRHRMEIDGSKKAVIKLRVKLTGCCVVSHYSCVLQSETIAWQLNLT